MVPMGIAALAAYRDFKEPGECEDAHGHGLGHQQQCAQFHRAVNPRTLGRRTKTSMKDTKTEARYGDPPNSTDRCGMCQHYRIGVCTKVEGRISPTMWCKHFKRRTDI